MSYDLHVVKTADFVQVDAEGRIDLEQSRRALSEIARACIARSINSALLDVRDARSDLSLADVYGLACSFNEMGFRREHRLAILHPFHGQRSEFFAMCAIQRGWNVRAFLEFEDAIEWLSNSEPV